MIFQKPGELGMKGIGTLQNNMNQQIVNHSNFKEDEKEYGKYGSLDPRGTGHPDRSCRDLL
jgi:hypothetical protein